MRLKPGKYFFNAESCYCSFLVNWSLIEAFVWFCVSVVALPSVTGLQLLDVTHSTMKASWDSVEGASGYMLLYGPLIEDGQLNEKEVLTLSCVNYENLSQDFKWPSTGHVACPLYIQKNSF